MLAPMSRSSAAGAELAGAGTFRVMAKIIISYRRSDSDVFAGRVRDRIVSRYGDQSVFRVRSRNDMQRN